MLERSFFFIVLKTIPKLSYCGLTIVLSNPSRFDTVSLLSAGANTLINDDCLRPEFNKMQCEIRIADDGSPLREGTKCVLLCGEYAMHKWLPETKDNTLNEMRGSVFFLKKRNIPCIPTFFPQDAADPRNHEQRLNTNSYEYMGRIEGEREEDDDGDEKTFSNTQRSNYAFWIHRDVWKAKQILLFGECAIVKKNPSYRIYPPADELITILTNTKGKFMDFDMETDYEEQNLLCCAFSFDDGNTVYCFPVLNNDYKWAYSSLHFILRALCIAVRDNVVVAHNGAGFDFLVLAMKYHIPVVKCWDPMIAMHRCFPSVEKSLGHCISYWTWEPFHKDMGNGKYHTHEDMMNMMRYCAKDVFTMSLVRQEIQKYAKTIPGLEYSIEVAQKSIRPYLTTTLLGISYNEEKRAALVEENDRLLMQYIRIIRLLIGESGMKEVQSVVKGKPGAMPNSNPQCVKYFHDMLEYPVVSRGKPNKITNQRQPSLAKKAMFTLRLKCENPVIDFINLFRITKLECSTPLGFVPFKDNENKITDPTAYSDENTLNVQTPSTKTRSSGQSNFPFPI